MKPLFLTIIMLALCLAMVKGQSHAYVDLSDKDFRRGGASLEGSWDFYWNKLLAPGDPLPGTPTKMHYPGLWNDYKGLSGKGFGTYVLSVVLPAERPLLLLTIPEVFSSYTLYIDGQKVAVNGVTGTSKETASPGYNRFSVPLPTDTDTLLLILQMSNFWHHKGGPLFAPTIAESANVLKKENTYQLLSIFIGAFFVLSGFVFMSIYLFAKKDKAILFFALVCWGYSYRLVGSEPYVLHNVLPNLNWFFTIRAEYLTIPLTIAFFGQYVRYLFPAETNKKIVTTMFSVCMGYVAAIVFLPVSYFTSILPYFLAVAILYIFYAFYVFIQAYKNKKPGSALILLSSYLVLAVFLVLILNYFDIVPLPHAVILLAYFVFLLLQILIICRRFAAILHENALQAQLGANAKAAFLATMSHELRTPLNGIIGMTNILQQDHPRPDQKESIDLLQFSANHLLNMVNDVLDYNKMEAQKMRLEYINMDLKQIAVNVIKSERNYSNAKNIDLLFEADDAIPTYVKGDPTKFTQVITNLVHNAIKFTNQGWVKLSLITQGISGQQVRIKIAVVDTGIGIAKEQQQIIFEKFTQADSSTARIYGGTGLGLTICKKLLELQGVKLELESEANKGASFWFVQQFSIVTE